LKGSSKHASVVRRDVEAVGGLIDPVHTPGRDTGSGVEHRSSHLPA
jgi:hypothetical protein